VTIHSKHVAHPQQGELGNIKTWGMRLRSNFARMNAHERSAGPLNSDGNDIADESQGKRISETAANIPLRPEDLPLSEDEYALMKRALVRQTNVQMIEQCYAHSLDVARWCVRVAQKRGMDAHMACLAGFFHDVYYYATGLRPLHEQNSAELAKELLSEYSELSPEDQLLICRAILCHHASATASDDLSRLLRDAHILNRYTSAGHTVRRHELDRLKQLVPEWKLLEPQRSQITDTPDPVYQGNRSALAEVAQTLAAQRLSWYADEPDAWNIARYWPEPDAFEALSGNWSAAFVYHCCYESGFILPIHALNIERRFDDIKAWLDFASLLNNGFYHPKGESGFVPERGDIVIFDRILEDKMPADHMGVVVMTSPERITVAEGNARKSNVSDVIEHSATHHVRGYIRLPNDFSARKPFN
jgi:HD superfamily phosphohydrolase YqeK